MPTPSLLGLARRSAAGSPRSKPHRAPARTAARPRRTADTDVLRALRRHTKLDDVATVTFVKTSLEASAIGVIASLAGLATVRLERNPGLHLEDARELRRRRPGVAVELDGAAVP